MPDIPTYKFIDRLRPACSRCGRPLLLIAHRTGGTRLRSANVLLRILQSERNRHREHLKTRTCGGGLFPASLHDGPPSAAFCRPRTSHAKCPPLIAPTPDDAAL